MSSFTYFQRKTFVTFLYLIFSFVLFIFLFSYFLSFSISFFLSLFIYLLIYLLFIGVRNIFVIEKFSGSLMGFDITSITRQADIYAKCIMYIVN